MEREEIKRVIEEGKTSLGIELGSTRIKAVLINEKHEVVASGSYDWENQLVDDIWTYSLEAVKTGLQAAYRALAEEVKSKYEIKLRKVGSIGISAMMHGYLVFDKEGRQMVEFRTWRNTMTEEAAAALTAEFGFNIPQRWSIAHLYQAMINKEEHTEDIDFLTTLAGYVHWQLSGEKVLGVDDASGVFPIDSASCDYDKQMISKFAKLSDGYKWNLSDILPKVLRAGEKAGVLSIQGAEYLDPGGELESGILLCPPEGDAGTGMVATNSVAERTGNISAGTSIFAMIVLEKALKEVHTEIDMVSTPDGKPVAMAHCNSCTSDLDAWMKMFEEVLGLFGKEVDKDDLYSVLYNEALIGDKDGGGLLAYNYYAGEPITKMEAGRPLLVRHPNSRFRVADLMRTLLSSSMATLKLGMDILRKQEDVRLEKVYGHGGLFKTKEVGQGLMAAALEVPVTVLETAGEGGAWGIAVLADYLVNKEDEESLADYLALKVFKGAQSSTMEADEEDIAGFRSFMKKYEAGLAIEKAAVDNLE